MTSTDSAEPGTDRLLVAELAGLLGDAEHHSGPGAASDSNAVAPAARHHGPGSPGWPHR
ncbi:MULTISPECIES: hypothetical protein [Streptomyces]|uniref:hypothetical protein n=1 Tax=Streptomyces TaxID=1883 RepID=UPI002248AE3C|nr:hypothetical protein [Streptomyces sp. JHD 1]MCX2968219.1 hypothetical protein [Streptomyces sp. JHD 1]